MQYHAAVCKLLVEIIRLFTSPIRRLLRPTAHHDAEQADHCSPTPVDQSDLRAQVKTQCTEIFSSFISPVFLCMTNALKYVVISKFSG